MGRRKSTYTVRCAESGCHESSFYEFDSQRERRESNVVGKPWFCVRHSNKDRVITPQRPYVEWLSEPVEERTYGKFASGNGVFVSQAYYAAVKDFPVGTIFKITCEAIMPSNSVPGS